jgi:cleavage and polyadenylation specificity factor subunit 5
MGHWLAHARTKRKEAIPSEAAPQALTALESATDDSSYIERKVLGLTSSFFSQSSASTPSIMSTITSTALQTSYPPILPKSFNANQPQTIRLYPLSNYTFGTKETQPEEDPSVLARLKRLEEHYVEHGMRRTCEGILVCHEHNHPHILMLQIANAFFKLPGDYLKPEDDEIDGFRMRLNERLAPVGTQFSGEGVNEEWEIGDTLAQWWRPNFETFMYPFIPAHVTRPKECKKLYFIQLPRQSKLPVKACLS